MTERNALGTSGAAAGMQDQGDIVGSGLDRLLSRRSVLQVCNALISHADREHRNLEVGSRAAGELGSYRRTKENFRVGIAQEEYEFFVWICRIQGRSSSCDRSSKEADQRGQSVGQHNGDAISAANARGGKRVRHRQHLSAQRVVGNDDLQFGHSDGSVTIRKMQYVE